MCRMACAEQLSIFILAINCLTVLMPKVFLLGLHRSFTGGGSALHAVCIPATIVVFERKKNTSCLRDAVNTVYQIHECMKFLLFSCNRVCM